MFALMKNGDVQVFLNAPEAAAAEYPAFKNRPLGGLGRGRSPLVGRGRRVLPDEGSAQPPGGHGAALA